MTPTNRGERTRDEILSAATAVVLESGPEAFSLREVARRAVLAPSALYNHFPSREELIAALARRALDDLNAYLANAGSGTTRSDSLRALGGAYLRFAAEHPNEYRLIFDCLSTPVAGWDHYVAVARPFTLIVEEVAQGLADKEFLDAAGIGPGGMAYALWALLHGHVSLQGRHLALLQGEDFDRFVAAAIDSLLDAWTRRCD
jgi:AcrR family transcriptional regulator